MKNKTLILSLAALAMVGMNVRADIAILNSKALQEYADSSNASTGTFDMSASSSSFLLFGVANSGTVVNNTFTVSSTGIGAGVALTRIGGLQDGDGTAAFYYLDRTSLGTSAETLTWNMNSGATYLDRISVQIFQLSGVDTSKSIFSDYDQTTNTGTTTSSLALPVAPTGAETYAVFTLGNGRRSGTGGINPAGDAAAWTYSEVTTNLDGHGLAYNLSVASGVTSAPAIQFTAVNSIRGVGSIALPAVIPEPGTLALFGLAGLAVVIGLRRRS